ncbi:hypothetical protein PFISCL1PPCAC_2326, partial [Pristionchus fissidentatus]
FFDFFDGPLIKKNIAWRHTSREMGAVKVEKGKVKSNLDKKEVKWLEEAFMGTFFRLKCAMWFSLICPLIVVISAPFMPLFFSGFGSILKSEGIRVFLTLFPHWIQSTILFFRTLTRKRNPMEKKKEWKSLAENTILELSIFIVHFILLSILSIFRLVDLGEVDKEILDSDHPDLSSACVVTLLNWFVCLFFTLLSMRTTIDQTRICKNIEKSMKSAFTTKLREISEYMCFGQSVNAMAHLYTALFGLFAFSAVGCVIGLLMLEMNWFLVKTLIACLFHLWCVVSVFNHITEKRISFRLAYFIAFLLLITLFNISLFYVSALSGEFYESCVELWNNEEFDPIEFDPILIDFDAIPTGNVFLKTAKSM